MLAAAGAFVLAACGAAADEEASGGGEAVEGRDCPPAVSSVEFDPSTGLGALPVASFSALDDDRVVCTSDWQGTPTVVNFWATWCGFCVDEMPDLQAAQEALGDRVRFVGIDRQDVREDALAFVEETGVEYDQVVSADGDYYDLLGNRGMPTTLFVDAEGTVVWRHTGPVTREQVLDLVATHLDVAA